MTIEKVTIESFLKDVNRHKMSILKDEGVYRHLRFKRPQSMTMYFDLITWPGNVCYTGDMGTYTFSRLNDMAYFFSDPDETDKTRPNMYYWAEKVKSESRYGQGIEQYCEDVFLNNVNDQFVDWKQDYLSEKLSEMFELNDNRPIDLAAIKAETAEEKEFITLLQETVDEVENEIDSHLSCKDTEFESSAYQAIMNFESYKLGKEGPNFEDFWEIDCRPYTYHYQWCCFALNWGFNQYFKHIKSTKVNYNFC